MMRTGAFTGRVLGRWRLARIDNSHSKTKRAPGHSLANAPISNQPQRLAMNIRAQHKLRLPALPAPRADEAVGFGNAASARQEQFESKVGCGFVQHTRCVGHENAMPYCALDIDVVISNGD